MTISPRTGSVVRDPGSGVGDPGSAGNDNTSVGTGFLLYWEFSLQMWASVTSATATSPRARAGAAAASHRDSPPSRTGRPRPSDTNTLRRLLSGSTVSFVRLHDLLHERMPHDVFFVEVNERDAFDVADHLGGFDE